MGRSHVWARQPIASPNAAPARDPTLLVVNNVCTVRPAYAVPGASYGWFGGANGIKEVWTPRASVGRIAERIALMSQPRITGCPGWAVLAWLATEDPAPVCCEETMLGDRRLTSSCRRTGVF
jgi:hypothetical protein